MSEQQMRVDDGGGRQKVVKVDYPSNSQKARDENQPLEEKKVEAVVTGAVIKRKRSPFARLAQNFVAEDSGSVLEYLIQEVLVPAAKGLISDIITQGLERKLYGESRPRSQNQRGYTNYAARSAGTSGPRTTPQGATVTHLNSRQRANHDFADIILVSRADAEDVLDRLRDLINEYKVATVSDFYDLMGMTGDFTDDKWGWFDLRNARIRTTRGGYMFDLPRTQPLV